MSLDIDKLSFGYNLNQTVLADISFSIDENEFISVVGPNGTGKTTLLKCINRILCPQAGAVTFNGNSIMNWQQKDIARIIAYAPQYANGAWPMQVINAVMMGRLPHAKGRYSALDREIVFSILQKMELEKFAFRDIRHLSGGERQKVAVARALAQQPKIVILDEPTSNLDLKNQLQILDLIASLCKAEHLAVIMSIHDLNLAAMFSDKMIMLKDARIYACGSPDSVLTQDNIAAVYGVDVSVTMEEGCKHVRLRKKQGVAPK